MMARNPNPLLQEVVMLVILTDGTSAVTSWDHSVNKKDTVNIATVRVHAHSAIGDLLNRSEVMQAH